MTLGQNKIQSSFLEPENYSQFVGGYFMWTMSSAIQTYSDFKIDQQNSEVFLYYVAGIRWTFKDGTEWRNEYIKKDLGLDRQERKDLEEAGLNPLLTLAILQSYKLNQDNLQSEEFYYSSLRKIFNSFNKFDSPLWGIRSLYSLTNQSGILSTFLETGLSDSITFTAYVAQTYGPTPADFNSVVHGIGGIFLRYSY